MIKFNTVAFATAILALGFAGVSPAISADKFLGDELGQNPIVMQVGAHEQIFCSVLVELNEKTVETFVNVLPADGAMFAKNDVVGSYSGSRLAEQSIVCDNMNVEL